jgi:uncharacterized membrane protein YfcA
LTIWSTINPLFSLSGLFVGTLVGLTGVGGGSLMTPLLVLVFGIHPATAVGTDLLYAAVTKGVGTAAHGMNKTVEWRVMGRLAAGSVPATAATVALLAFFGRGGQVAPAFINTVLGLALMATATSLFLRKWLLVRLAGAVDTLSERSVAVLTVVTGVVLGCLVSLTSVGAGAIGITVLLLLYPRVPVARIVGADIAHAVPLTLIAGLGHWFLGSVDGAMLVSLLIGSVPGILIGSYLTAFVPERVLRPLIATVLAVVGFRMVF